MLTRLAVIWAETKGSLWFLPALMTLVSIVLAFTMVQLDRVFPADSSAGIRWLFSGGVEGARGVLSAIAGGIITVTGVVFSVTIIALQLASSQFTPRVLHNFTADRANQVVLGVFIGTFTYTLLVLRSVRSANADAVAFVPSLSITVAIALALVSIGFLIFFIDHTARSIQASSIVDRAAEDALRRFRDLFPEHFMQPEEGVGAAATVAMAASAAITAEEAGYLQSVGEDALCNIANRARLTIEMVPRIGDFVLPGAVLAYVWPPAAIDERVVRDVRKAFVLGKARSPEQDAGLGITQLVDIAVKALSPGINDPTTAKTCIDHLAEIIVVLGNRAMPVTKRTDQNGRLLFIAQSMTFQRAIELAFAEIQHYGARSPSIIMHLLSSLRQVVRLVPRERRRPVVERAASILATARQGIIDNRELAEVERAGKWLEEEKETA